MQTHQTRTIMARIHSTDEYKHSLSFHYRACVDVDLNRELDVLGNCDPTSPFLLQKGKWNKVHVTIQKFPNRRESTAVRSNNHCPYAKSVKCITVKIPDKASELLLRAEYASVNCISGKI